MKKTMLAVICSMILAACQPAFADGYSILPPVDEKVGPEQRGEDYTMASTQEVYTLFFINAAKGDVVSAYFAAYRDGLSSAYVKLVVEDLIKRLAGRGYSRIEEPKLPDGPLHAERFVAVGADAVLKHHQFERADGIITMTVTTVYDGDRANNVVYKRTMDYSTGVYKPEGAGTTASSIMSVLFACEYAHKSCVGGRAAE